MGRMTENDANALRQIRKGTRARILYLYKGEETFHYRIGRALARQGNYAGAQPEMPAYARGRRARRSTRPTNGLPRAPGKTERCARDRSTMQKAWSCGRRRKSAWKPRRCSC